MFIILSGWFVIVSVGLIAGLIFNKMIIDEKLLKIFNISLIVILAVITVYFLYTIKEYF